MKSWYIIAGAQAQPSTDAQMGHSVGQIGGTVAPAQAGVAGLLRVQGCGQWRGEVQVGEVRQGAPCAHGRWEDRHISRLVRRREDVDSRDFTGSRSRGRGGQLLSIPRFQQMLVIYQVLLNSRDFSIHLAIQKTSSAAGQDTGRRGAWVSVLGVRVHHTCVKSRVRACPVKCRWQSKQLPLLSWEAAPGHHPSPARLWGRR